MQVSLLAQIPGVVLSWPLHPSPAAIAGAGFLAALGVWLNVAAVRQFNRQGAGVIPFSGVRALARGGPYRFSRNPMYLGLVALSAALAVGTGVWWNVLAAVCFWMWLHFAYVLPEEKFLRERFGAAFDEYARRIPRWLGFPRRAESETNGAHG